MEQPNDNKGGRPAKLDPHQKRQLRTAHRIWIDEQARRFKVNPLTIRRALTNEKKAPGDATTGA